MYFPFSGTEERRERKRRKGSSDKISALDSALSALWKPISVLELTFKVSCASLFMRPSPILQHTAGPETLPTIRV